MRAGKYTVEVKDKQGPKASKTIDTGNNSRMALATEEKALAPVAISNSPNPFSEKTTITFSLAQEENENLATIPVVG